MTAPVWIWHGLVTGLWTAEETTPRYEVRARPTRYGDELGAEPYVEFSIRLGESWRVLEAVRLRMVRTAAECGSALTFNEGRFVLHPPHVAQLAEVSHGRPFVPIEKCLQCDGVGHHLHWCPRSPKRAGEVRHG